MRSTSGYAFTFGNGVFSWASVKQQCVALSTAEVEYISASEATAQATWLRFVLEDFGEMQAKTKHINRRYHYIKEALQQGVIDLLHCPTKEEVVDIFTKALAREQFSYLRELLGVKSIHNLKGKKQLDLKSDLGVEGGTFLFDVSQDLATFMNCYKETSLNVFLHENCFPYASKPGKWLAAIRDLLPLTKDTTVGAPAEGAHLHSVHLSDSSSSLDLINEGFYTYVGGHVDMLSSDYLPTMPELMLLDDGDFSRAWGGIPSLQRAIAIGNHADMEVWDPYVEFDLDDGHPVYLKHSGISASLGTKLSGRVSATFVKGNLVSKRGSMQRSDSGKIIKNLD
ncbi:unnamed protein product [Prunus armeniaca]